MFIHMFQWTWSCGKPSKPCTITPTHTMTLSMHLYGRKFKSISIMRLPSLIIYPHVSHVVLWWRFVKCLRNQWVFYGGWSSSITRSLQGFILASHAWNSHCWYCHLSRWSGISLPGLRIFCGVWYGEIPHWGLTSRCKACDRWDHSNPQVCFIFLLVGRCHTNILGMYYRYKDLETAQAEGKSFSFLPPSATVPNASLLRNGKSNRDRNRMVAPIIISKAFGWCPTYIILLSVCLCFW